MKAAVVDDNGKAYPPATLPTEPHLGQERGLQTMCDTIREAIHAAGVTLDDIAAIGVATPGSMDLQAGLILDPPNLKPWRNVPVRQHIADVFGKTTAFQNDANAAAFGEYWLGAGRHVDSMVMFTLGTGIGGGIVIGGKLLEGRHSHGGEVGHIRISMTRDRLCGCGKYGCLEAYASATAVVKRTREALQSSQTRSKLHALLGSPDSELTSREIFQAADQGDELAMQIVDDTAFYLAIGAVNLMHTVDPDMVVFGGGMIAAGEGFLNKIRKHIREQAFAWPAERTEVRYAELGSDAGFIGAAGCARQLLQRM